MWCSPRSRWWCASSGGGWPRSSPRAETRAHTSRSLSTAVVRQAILTTMTSYRDAAVALWDEAGGYCHDAYDRLHPLYPELPEAVPIVIGITAYGHCIGLTRADWSSRPRITIASNQFQEGTAVV